MKKTLAVLAVGAFAVAASTSAFACGYGKVASTKSAPISTAMDSHPITPKPQPKSGS